MNKGSAGAFDVSKWHRIGTVVGNTSTASYTFTLKNMRARLGDIVAVELHVPLGTGELDKHRHVLVWGRITGIDRFNPFFPHEAAQELAEESLSLLDTVLSNSRDQLQADVLVLGASDVGRSDGRLSPLTYPVQPASEVLYPSAEAITILLAGEQKGEVQLHIGSLIARGDVSVDLSANKVVSRHIAVLAMTGGGKTVAVRRIVKELIDLKYPLIIFDPHGDYLGLYEKRGEFKDTEVKLFYPHITASRNHRDVIYTLIEKMGIKLTDPQAEFLNYLIERHEMKAGTPIKNYINELESFASNIKRRKAGKDEDLDLDIQTRTMSVVMRSLREVGQKLYKMQSNNALLRDRFKNYQFTEMPDPINAPEELVSPGQVSIMYLAGYDHITQSAIVSIVLEALFDHRAELADRIPPFQVVLEEAHNFIPSRSEGTDDTPSLATVRKLITEGRKFGTGLIVVSQRPSRLDETTLSQCNSFLVLRLVNPRDQNFVRNVMENLPDSDARLLPTFGPGQGIVSGQAVRFPLLVQVKFDEELVSESIGDENFIEKSKKWKPSEAQKQKKENAEIMKDVLKKSIRGQRGR